MRPIDADAAIEALTEYGNGRAVYIGVEEAVRRIEQLPSIQPDTTTHDSISAETGKNDGDKTSGGCISRQAMLDGIDKLIKIHFDRTVVLYKARKVAEDLPSAQPEIIRCKDCKYCEHWYADKGRCFLWHESGIDVFEEGFCNYAERRTDG